MGTHKKGKSCEAVRLGLPLMKKMYGDVEVEYYPLGKYIVVQPGVCGGRPTVLNRRITAEGILGALARGDSIQQVARGFQIPAAAVKEAVALADKYDYQKSYAHYPFSYTLAEPGTRQAGKRTKAMRLGLPLMKRVLEDEEIEYYPLGKYLVIQPGVCGGRPTVLNTRIGGRDILGALARGDKPKQIAEDFRIPLAAIQEAVRLANQYDYEQSYA